MATINQVEKTDYEAIKIDYTSRDYINILDDLINSISGISEKWSSTDENDPGMILIKMMSMVGDMLNYNLDYQSLEVYPNSVTQRKNAASIYKLIGYKMRWYQSAILEANIVNTYSNSATLPRFCTFTTESSGVTYTTFDQYELPSNTSNNGLETTVELIQGTPVTPVRSSSNPYPDAGKAWHTIYSYNYTTDDLVNNRLYLNDQNIDQDHIILVDDQNEEWTLKDNIYLTEAVGRFFEFDVDVNDQPYLELIDYWSNYNITKFKVFYIKSAGEDGAIYANTLKYLTGNVWSRESTTAGSTIYNVSGFIHFTHYDSSIGYDPETPDEARKESIKYLNTMDTLITLADFERATLREPGVANVRATDLTNDPGTKITHAIGNITMDTVESITEEGEVIDGENIDEEDVEALSNYLADSSKYPLTTYQKKLADCNQDGEIDYKDLECLKEYLNPTQWYIGDINQDNEITSTDLEHLETYVADPTTQAKNYTDFQIRLMDINQDGNVDETDISLLSQYLSLQKPVLGSLGTLTNPEDAGDVGVQYLSDTELLDSFVVKLYILRTEQYEDIDDDTYSSMITTDLQEYKILPLTLQVDLHSINKYYWTIKGTFFTKEPLSRDDLQTIIVNINNQLKYDYAIEKVNFNTSINYKEVIEEILDVDNRILMVDLDPIEYVDEDGNTVTKEQLTASYTLTVPQLTNSDATNNLYYNFTIPEVPILPGSIMIRINNSQYTLRDNNNGDIYNVDNILTKKGSIDYTTGEVSLLFNAELTSDMIVSYTHNAANIAVYRNLNTQTFYFDASSLESDDTQDLV